MTGPDDTRSDDDLVLPPGALHDLGEQLRSAASHRSELLARPSTAAGGWPTDLDLLEDDVDGDAGAGTGDDRRGATKVPLTAATTRSRRTPALIAVMGIAAALVLVVASFVLSGHDAPPASAGVRVDRSGQTITVRIDGSTDVPEVVDALQSAGVVADVEAQATGPSRVGRFTGLSSSVSQGPMDDVADGSVLTFESGDQVTIYVGVQAEGDQAYDSATDGLAEGEPFAGLDRVVGMTWDEARPILEERAASEGIEVQLVGGGQGTVSSVQMVSAHRALVLA